MEEEFSLALSARFYLCTSCIVSVCCEHWSFPFIFTLASVVLALDPSHAYISLQIVGSTGSLKFSLPFRHPHEPLARSAHIVHCFNSIDECNPLPTDLDPERHNRVVAQWFQRTLLPFEIEDSKLIFDECGEVELPVKGATPGELSQIIKRSPPVFTYKLHLFSRRIWRFNLIHRHLRGLLMTQPYAGLKNNTLPRWVIVSSLEILIFMCAPVGNLLFHDFHCHLTTLIDIPSKNVQISCDQSVGNLINVISLPKIYKLECITVREREKR